MDSSTFVLPPGREISLSSYCLLAWLPDKSHTSIKPLRLGQNGWHFEDDISIAFYWMKIFIFWFKFQWRLLPRVQLRISHRHYNDVIMSMMASHITSLTIVYSTIYSGADQREHQSSASLAFVWGILRWPVMAWCRMPSHYMNQRWLMQICNTNLLLC